MPTAAILPDLRIKDDPGSPARRWQEDCAERAQERPEGPMNKNSPRASGAEPQVSRAIPQTPLAHAVVRSDETRHVRFELSPRTMVALVARRRLPVAADPALARPPRARRRSPRRRHVEPGRPLARREAREARAGIAIVFTVFFVLALLVVALTIPTLVSQAAALLEHEPALRARLADHLAGSHLSAPLANWLRGLKYDAARRAPSARRRSPSRCASSAPPRTG